MTEKEFRAPEELVGVVSYMLGTAVSGITSLTSDHYLMLLQVYERHTHNIISGIQLLYKNEAKRIITLTDLFDSTLTLLDAENILPKDSPIKADVSVKLIYEKTLQFSKQLKEFYESVEKYLSRESIERKYQEICTELHTTIVWMESFYDNKFDEIQKEKPKED